jgi:hypothetical protein
MFVVTDRNASRNRPGDDALTYCAGGASGCVGAGAVCSPGWAPNVTVSPVVTPDAGSSRPASSGTPDWSTRDRTDRPKLDKMLRPRAIREA